jgi:uncharacterized protein (DUF4415 family)
MKYKTAPDPDKPLTEAEFRSMKTVYGLDGLASIIGEEHVSPLRLRGRPVAAAPKTPVNLRLDANIVKHFRAMGKGWQTKLNDFLRKSVEQGLV